MSFDWSKYKGGSGAFVKFEEVGDEIVGTIVAIREHTFDKDKGPVVLLDLARKSDGEAVTLACDKVDLRMQMADLEPQVSDLIAVKFTGEEKTPNGRKKMFAIRHKQGDRPAAEPDDGFGYAPDEEPF